MNCLEKLQHYTLIGIVKFSELAIKQLVYHRIEQIAQLPSAPFRLPDMTGTNMISWRTTRNVLNRLLEIGSDNGMLPRIEGKSFKDNVVVPSQHVIYCLSSILFKLPYRR